ncbi:MAG TPA: hypothetical protein VN721_05315 [Flavipsychrobacter sp.]|nr:hypothetical protein [Flavipsychrobacter sp.]
MQIQTVATTNFKKRIFLVLSLFFVFNNSHAQSHFFAEVGINTESNAAVSGIYSLDVSKKWGLGIGATLQRYSTFVNSNFIKIVSPNVYDEHIWRPSFYADVRRKYDHRKNEINWFLDFGGVLYQNSYSYPIYNYTDNIGNAWYESIGIGYYRKLKKSRIRPYISLRLQNILYTQKEELDFQRRESFIGEFYFMLAIGVKFP